MANAFFLQFQWEGKNKAKETGLALNNLIRHCSTGVVPGFFVAGFGRLEWIYTVLENEGPMRGIFGGVDLIVCKEGEMTNLQPTGPHS